MLQWNRAKALALLAGVSVLGGTASANVTVARVGSQVNINGDAGNDSIIIRKEGVDLVVEGTSGTLVNGTPRVRITGFTPEIVNVNMGAGNDTIRLQNLLVTQDLIIDLGAGTDVIVCPAPVQVNGNVSVLGQEGTDIVRLREVIIGGDLTLNGGTGSFTADLVKVTGGNACTVIGGDINDLVTIAESTFEGTIDVTVAGGADRVRFNTVEALFVNIDTGAGNDVVLIWNTEVEGNFDLTTGAGDDVVDLFHFVVWSNLTIALDAGVDYLRAAFVAVQFDLSFAGGTDVDTFSDRGNVFSGDAFLTTEFEVGG